MKHAQRERWLQRCDQAAVGQETEKFLRLITEINAYPKKERLTSATPAQPTPADKPASCWTPSTAISNNGVRTLFAVDV